MTPKRRMTRNTLNPKSLARRSRLPTSPPPIVPNYLRRQKASFPRKRMSNPKTTFNCLAKLSSRPRSRMSICKRHQTLEPLQAPSITITAKAHPVFKCRRRNGTSTPVLCQTACLRNDIFSGFSAFRICFISFPSIPPRS